MGSRITSRKLVCYLLMGLFDDVLSTEDIGPTGWNDVEVWS
jgi:hypothetical protein